MSKSYFMSIIVHLGLFTAALLVTPPLIEKLDEKEIVVEIMDAAPAPEMKASAIAMAPAAPAAAENKADDVVPVPAEEIAPEIAPAKAVAKKEAQVEEEIKVPAQKAKPVVKAKLTHVAPVVKKSAPAIKSTAKAKVQIASRAPVPETLDDIESSDLDYDAVEMAPAAALSDGDLDSEFAKIDKKTEAQMKAQQSAMDNEAQSIEQETNEALAGIESENKEKQKAMSDALEATRSKNAALLAEMRAGEEAAAQAKAKAAARAAEIAAANAAREKAAADRAAQLGAARSAQVGAARQAQARGEGTGSGNLASGQGQVRSIENLKQRDGNPKPQYSLEERFRKETGTVIYHAFVTSEGKLEQFKLVQSTGYKNLDGKTLAALKKWRFYPGQQGWVEIPQTWNLKGDVQEMPATLRRSLTKNK